MKLNITRHRGSTLAVLAAGWLTLQPGCSSDASKGDGDTTSTNASSDASSNSSEATTGSGGTGDSTSSASNTGAGGNTTGGGGGGGNGGVTAVVGTFEVELVPEQEETENAAAREAFTSVLGRVYDYPVPNQIDWELEDEQAGCRLLVPRIPFCDPACSGGAVCSEADECTPFPEAFDLGEVTLTGIATQSGEDVTMDPLPPSNTYQPLASAGILYPPFAAGDSIALATEGGDLEPFSVTATGIDELVLMEPEAALTLAPDTPAELGWQSPQSEGSHIEVVIDISHHGGQKGEIVCEVEDSGQLTIPAELVTGLIDLGFSGFPTVLISRVATGATMTSAGQVELKLVSAIELAIEIPGLVSCEEAGTTEGCPDGETCQDDLKCG